jgi:hypothetical protein
MSVIGFLSTTSSDDSTERLRCLRREPELGVLQGPVPTRVTQFNYRFTTFAGHGGHINPQLGAVTKDRYICNLLPKVKPVKTIGFGTLISSVALIASTLCLQAAITQDAPTGNKGPKDTEQRSVDLSSEIDSAREHN